ncbi:hypothetical protein HanRHA438_Chr11g0490071 [Helianthus annuus]|nr:hypothetical protein HanHA300_Chr11g0390831 [Helianthus annuus]KAJ0516436.1 hypothetical protein HanHA89_Chr11g0413851 [Helianthus annuus]KAJ0684438.1 hypothetical protein HanLR1_Chr11g0391191 [Helianthus annuus]KAJ0869524.1 hypothetical protein HanRHA438_Chr11g0490071 [Helianthus annuus]
MAENSSSHRQPGPRPKVGNNFQIEGSPEHWVNRCQAALNTIVMQIARSDFPNIRSGKEINTTELDPSTPRWGDIQSSQYRDSSYQKQIHMVQGGPSRRPNKRNYDQHWREQQVVFPVIPGGPQEERPVIITGIFGHYQTDYMFIDPGSSTDIIYEQCFKQLDSEDKARLEPVDFPLTGFCNEVVFPLGQIAFPVTLSDGKHSRTVTVNFMVMPATSRHDVLLGRRSQRENKHENRERRWTPLTKTPAEVLSTKDYQFKPPIPMESKRGQDPTQYCEYHKDNGHTTNNCISLRTEIEKALKNGELTHLLQNMRMEIKQITRGQESSSKRAKT